MSEHALEIDGSHGEGGGQLLRTAVALAAITQRSLVVHNIRARRHPPGLAPQHVAAVRAVAALCHAATDGLELRSGSLEFRPGVLRGGKHRIDVGTAGSITLVLQAMLPVMLAGHDPVEATITGGTDVRQSPALDYLVQVLLPLLARAGARIKLDVARRGYYPAGGGEVHVAVQRSVLRPLRLDDPGALAAIEGVAHVANLRPDIAHRMRAAALNALAAVPGPEPRIETRLLSGDAAVGHGGAIAVWARTESSVLGASRVAERGVPAEVLGAAVGEEIASDLAARAGVDVHAADQLLIYLALAGGGSYTARVTSPHARTAMWLIEQFLPVRFVVEETERLARVIVVPHTM